ncbi:MAG: hypothetical protein IIC93_11470 [Chloroflexi bacterium]|nr:hypothetical protein [Chloroflexota bacterium]
MKAPNWTLMYNPDTGYFDSRRARRSRFRAYLVPVAVGVPLLITAITLIAVFVATGSGVTDFRYSTSDVKLAGFVPEGQFEVGRRAGVFLTSATGAMDGRELLIYVFGGEVEPSAVPSAISQDRYGSTWFNLAVFCRDQGTCDAFWAGLAAAAGEPIFPTSFADLSRSDGRSQP